MGKSYFAAEGNSVLAARHRYGVIHDVGRREPWLNIGITRSRTKSLKLVVEAYGRRVFVARYSGDLRQLVGRLSVDPATIGLVILKAESQVIYQVGVEGVVPVHSQYRCTFKGGAAIADRYRKSCERGRRQVLVVKHFGDVVLGANVFIHFLRDAVRIRA